MSKELVIVYSEQDDDSGYRLFTGKDAEIVERALFDAESRHASVCHFTTESGHTYWLRTDKYLYWTTYEPLTPNKNEPES